MVTSDRAQAYGRVVRTLDDLGQAKLNASEQERIREVADALLFSDDPTDDVVRRALEDIETLAETLTTAGRWSDERARRLVGDVTACGPLAPVA